MTGEEIIAKRREQRHSFETLVRVRAAECYGTFDDNEKTVVQFGMLPHVKTCEAERKLRAELVEIGHDGEHDLDDVGRLFAVGIMDAANAGSKKMVV